MSIAAFRDAIRRLLGGRRARRSAIVDRDGLREFLRTRASHVAQTSLYGYLRTRAGTRYPELFADDGFIELVNIAKWHIWLDCLADLAIYAGGLLLQRSQASAADITRLMSAAVDAVLAQTGVPAEAGAEYAPHAARVRARLALSDWTHATHGETAFAESPGALVTWAPMIEEFKRLDEEIVRNSVRFRWREVRRELEMALDGEAVAADALRTHDPNNANCPTVATAIRDNPRGPAGGDRRD